MVLNFGVLVIKLLYNGINFMWWVVCLFCFKDWEIFVVVSCNFGEIWFNNVDFLVFDCFIKIVNCFGKKCFNFLVVFMFFEVIIV